MKILKQLTIAALTCLCTPYAAVAQECEVPVSVVVMEQTEPIQQAAADMLVNSLKRIIVNGGMSAELNFSQFIMSAQADVIEKQVVAGPPTQVVYKFGVTIYLADVYNKKKFSSQYIEVNGVGQNEAKAQINAFRQIGSRTAQLGQMLQDGKQKIMDYYNTNYQQILKDAERCASLQQYEQAIALTITIPACTKGGNAAISAGMKYYAKIRDRYALQLLSKAQSLWAAAQTADVANEVADILLQIDPEASCYKEAKALIAEIKSQVRKDIDFETREKYKDAIDLERRRTEAIRAIGVAYGNGQKPQTTNLTWLR